MAPEASAALEAATGDAANADQESAVGDAANADSESAVGDTASAEVATAVGNTAPATSQSARYPSLSQTNPHRNVPPYREVPNFPPKRNGGTQRTLRNRQQRKPSYASSLKQRQSQPLYRKRNYAPLHNNYYRPYYYNANYPTGYNSFTSYRASNNPY